MLEGNSFKSKENTETSPPKTKVVTGQVTEYKESFGNRLMKVALGGDPEEIKNKLVWQIIIPGAIDGVRQILHRVIDNTFSSKGNLDITSTISNGTIVTWRPSTDYQKASQQTVQVTNGVFKFKELIIPSLKEAEKVLNDLQYSIEAYGKVSVLDYYDLVGVKTKPFYANYGWSDINGTQIIEVDNGYLIKLPNAVPINK